MKDYKPSKAERKAMTQSRKASKQGRFTDAKTLRGTYKGTK